MEDEFWREEYICPICLNKKVLCDPAPQCCGHYMVEFGVWEKDKTAFLKSREYTLALDQLRVEIGGIIEEMHEDEEGRRIIDKVKLEHMSLVPEDEVVDALVFLSDDYIVRMPPLSSYPIRVRITSVTKGTPRFVGLEDEWDGLSDEALEEFEKLVEESEPTRKFIARAMFWTGKTD